MFKINAGEVIECRRASWRNSAARRAWPLVRRRLRRSRRKSPPSRRPCRNPPPSRRRSAHRPGRREARARGAARRRWPRAPRRRVRARDVARIHGRELRPAPASAPRRQTQPDDDWEFSDAGRSGKWVGMRGYIHLLASAALAALLAGCSATGHNSTRKLSTLTPGKTTLEEASRALTAPPDKYYKQTDGTFLALWSFKITFVPDGFTAARKRCCSSALMAACCASWTAPIFCWNLGSVRSCWDRRRLRKTIRSRLLRATARGANDLDTGALGAARARAQERGRQVLTFHG